MRRDLLHRFVLSVGPSLQALSDAAEALHSAPTEAEADRA
jgi:hypothetical protein